jgi:glycosyltransferase A (GT-A) superfamily protein (DUF2064 family)
VSTIIVIAKAPLPGRVKTRLSPACTPAQAAELAEASLADTLAAVASCGPDRAVVALDGPPGAWLPDGFEVVAQRGAGLGERLAAAFEDTGGPALVVGMDTPQLTPGLLRAGLGAPCALGLAADGGWWALSLPGPDARVFAGIPMSADDTGARQRSRLQALGYAPVALPVLRDVDTIADAHRVAALAPGSRFAATLLAMDLEAAA